MTKLFGGFAAGALLLALALPGTASAADKRADGVTNANKATQVTEFSSRHRRWHRPRYVRRYYRPYYYPYAYVPPPYYYYPRPYYYPRSGFSFGFRF